MGQRLEASEHWPVIKIVGIYILFGTLWIFFSDSILGWIVRDPERITRISIYKGLIYIFLTAALLYALIYRHVYQDSLTRKQIKASEERTRLFSTSTCLNWTKRSILSCRLLNLRPAAPAKYW